jgi:hypothetical protein
MKPDRRLELAVFATLACVYVATLAPSVTLWDSGEFLSAIHSLGIPHPPGTPLYVLVANVWAKIFSPVVGFAYSINLLSAICSALAGALMANLFAHWTGDRLAAYAAAVCAGATSSIWLSATETEVYSSALLIGCLIFWIADRARISGERKWIILGAYVAGLGFALHLTALLTVPAALYLAWSRKVWRNTPALPVAFLLGASAVLFMLVRAKHDPAINQGNPSTIPALIKVILRRQYAVAPVWPRQAPIYLQIGNIFEYADWQFARGLAPDAPPSWWRTPITVLYAALGIVGFFAHRTMDRRSWRAMALLLFVSSLGVIVYLNLKAGPSFGAGYLPANAPHEARERDYFFFFAFVCWGLWAGFGSIRLSRLVRPPMSTLAMVLPFAPALLNWAAADRRTNADEAKARVESGEMLSRVPPTGVVLARGDIDTYPLWYLQQAEGTRRDVTIVTVPLLGAEWYRAELARRYKLLDSTAVNHWLGTDSTVALLTKRSYDQNRPVIRSPFFELDSAKSGK